MGKRVGCVVMAAGLSSRYGANKLLERLEGRSLIERTLEAVPLEAFSAAAVVAWHPEILGLAERRGFLAVENDRPQDGASRTVRLGLEAVGRCDGALFLVADQPRLRRGSILAVLRRWEEIKKGEKGSLDKFENVLSHMKEKGCEAVILACTELSVLMMNYPTLHREFVIDAMDVLCEACITICGGEIKGDL